MSAPNLAVVILAAGMGTRMKSATAKVLHAVAGRPMIDYPVALARGLGAARVVLIVGHQAERVRDAVAARFGTVEIAIQAEQRGTGHAVQQAAPLLAGFDGKILILYGDVPLVTETLLAEVVARASATTLSMVTFRPPVAHGYGRIIRDGGRVVRIVEERDATDGERAIGECNAGIYCAPAKFLFSSLAALAPNNAQGEVYLTDVVARAAGELSVATIEAPTGEVAGVNDRVDLARADGAMRLRLAEALMRAGVTVRDPERLHIEPGVIVGADTELGAGVELRGHTVVGAGCKIESGSVLTNVTVGDLTHIRPYCILTDSRVGKNVRLGPFAHLRPGSDLSDDVHVGNFVETKATRIGRASKANHLSYLGDAEIGEGVNVGCGTITCNYDGYKKYKTVIEDNVFIGSDTQLVAPVTVGKGAVTGAGSTITKDVPPGALALTRVPEQTHIEGYAEKKRQKMQEDNKSGG